MEVVVRCSKLSRTFVDGTERRRVLDALSLTVERGELVAIVGQSGSGKSTLLAAMGGLDRAFEGELELFGRAIRDMSDSDVSRLRGRSIGFVFQSFHLLAHLTALDNVLLPSLFGERIDRAEERAKDALARVGLSDRANDRPMSLSGGQRQRVAIARALLTRPPLLLCDEPTGNLDVATGAQIIEIFRELHRSGDTTFVIVTHDDRIGEAATRVMRLTEGRLAPAAEDAA